MLSMFQAGFAVVHLLGSPMKSFSDESQSDGSAVTESALTKDIWWHVSFMLFGPHFPSFQETVVTSPDEDVRRGFEISLVARACVSERRQTATGGKRVVEPCINQVCCCWHLSPDIFSEMTFSAVVHCSRGPKPRRPPGAWGTATHLQRSTSRRTTIGA